MHAILMIWNLKRKQIVTCLLFFFLRKKKKLVIAVILLESLILIRLNFFRHYPFRLTPCARSLKWKK